MLSLRNPYISVAYDGGDSFGGMQQRSSDPVIAKCGCGVIAAMDTLLYLSRFHADCGIEEFKSIKAAESVSPELYEKLIGALAKRYLPLIPPFGMNGVALALGFDLFLLRHGLPLRARWGVSREKLWTRMEEMLAADMPVILSIGPDFPRFWQRNQAPLYVRREDGRYVKAAETRAHYVVAVGMDERWIELASWGRRYFLDRREYMEFADRHTTNMLSNILYIRHT